jgi:hypothetical protein
MMKAVDLWRDRGPRSPVVRYFLYAATIAIVILIAVLAVRLRTTKTADDCNKPAAPVEVPKAPPGLIVDAPCTDGSASPNKAPTK